MDLKCISSRAILSFGLKFLDCKVVLNFYNKDYKGTTDQFVCIFACIYIYKKKTIFLQK